MAVDKEQEVSLVAACLDFFGRLPGQGIGSFQAEYKALTSADKAEIRQGLIANGYKIKIQAGDATQQ